MLHEKKENLPPEEEGTGNLGKRTRKLLGYAGKKLGRLKLS